VNSEAGVPNFVSGQTDRVSFCPVFRLLTVNCAAAPKVAPVASE
jgi:hypothetical protein